ncbi:MAG: hypothetical protein Q9219_002885 [cf. Caloplaca sp. 3 TL-2023]
MARLSLPDPVDRLPLDAELGSITQHFRFEERQETEPSRVCGYETGDPTKPRTFDPGYVCLVRSELWGICPEDSPADCELAGACEDLVCTDQGLEFCSTALLTLGDQSLIYTNIACGKEARTDNFLATPTTGLDSPTTTGSPSALPKPSNISPSSTAISTSNSTPNPDGPEPSANASTNTGAIVGGVIGGLAIIGLATFALLVLRRLKLLRFKAIPASLPFWRWDKKRRKEPTDRHDLPSELDGSHRGWLDPIELSAGGELLEMPSEHDTLESYKDDSEAAACG